MIPLLSLMIGSYIVVRMVSFIFRKKPREEHWAVQILAGIVGLVAIICVILIFKSSQEASSLMQGF